MKDKGSPLFLSQLFICVLHLFQEFEVALQGILPLPSLDLTWCDINGEPLSFVRPTMPPQLIVSDPSLTNLAQLRFRNPD